MILRFKMNFLKGDSLAELIFQGETELLSDFNRDGIAFVVKEIEMPLFQNLLEMKELDEFNPH
jgi:hypothetical protein